MKFLQITTISKLQCFYFGVTFIIVIIDFYKTETVHFNVICVLNCLLLNVCWRSFAWG
jgi:hypothetical protein